MSNDDLREGRIRAAIAGHIGDESLARTSLSSDDPPSRCLALGALQRMDSLSSSELSAALNDPSASVRRRALEITAGRSDVNARCCLTDADPSVAEAAAFAVGEQMDVAGVRPLIEMAERHDDALCRESAVAALGALVSSIDVDGEAILGCLLGAMNDKAQIRRRAVLGLFQFDDPRAQKAMEEALGDTDRQVRSIAADLLSVG
ncbi:MAG: hypothetical protein QF637_07010 [Acidimicrobiales bacterium]|nr:hypothetical protein [Acidimicrobiales bacterium]